MENAALSFDQVQINFCEASNAGGGIYLDGTHDVHKLQISS